MAIFELTKKGKPRECYYFWSHKTYSNDSRFLLSCKWFSIDSQKTNNK